jgi:hypothetical protein
VFGGVSYSSIECHSFLTFRLEGTDGSDPLVVGPRRLMCMRNRYLFAGREHLATLDPVTGLWNSRGRKKSWPLIQIYPA